MSDEETTKDEQDVEAQRARGPVERAHEPSRARGHELADDDDAVVAPRAREPMRAREPQRPR